MRKAIWLVLLVVIGYFFSASPALASTGIRFNWSNPQDLGHIIGDGFKDTALDIDNVQAEVPKLRNIKKPPVPTLTANVLDSIVNVFKPVAKTQPTVSPTAVVVAKTPAPVAPVAEESRGPPVAAVSSSPKPAARALTSYTREDVLADIRAALTKALGTTPYSDGLSYPYHPVYQQIANQSISTGFSTGRAIELIQNTTNVNGATSLSDLTGTLGVANGGTGITSAPSYGNVLVGNSSGGYDLVATSSLGITADFAGTTDDITEGTVNKFYNNSLVIPFIHASTTIPKTYTANTFTNAITFTSTFTATGGLSTLSNLLLTGSTTLLNVTALNATTTNATTTSLFASVASTTNLFATNLSAAAITSGLINGQTISSAASFTGTVTATGGLVTVANMLHTASTTLQNFTGANATTTAATTTALFASVASTTNLFATNLSAAALTSGLVNGQTISSAANFTGTVTATGGLVTVANMLHTASTTLQNFTGANATTTAATTTALFASVASSTTAFTTNFTAASITSGLINSQTISSAANFTGTVTATGGLTTLANLLLTGSTTLQNFTARSATTTAATTTALFASVASSTTSFTTNFTAASITSGLINSQTISSAANFTGTVTATGGLTTLSNLLLTGSSTLQNFTGQNATTTNATTTSLLVSSILYTKGSSTFDVATLNLASTTATGMTINYLASTTNLTALTQGSWAIASSSSASGNPVINVSFSSTGATSTVGFFVSTSTGLIAGVGNPLPSQLKNYVIVGNGKVQAGMAVVNGGICVDSDGWCSATTTGQVTAVTLATGNSDLAEIYYSHEQLEPGDLVTVDDPATYVKKASHDGTSVIGVVSTKPGLILGLGPDQESTIPSYPIALAGRVPIKVSTANGPIATGDFLGISEEDGVAVKTTKDSQVIAQALEPYTGSENGKIMAIIKSTYYKTSDATKFADLRDSIDASDSRIALLEKNLQALTFATTSALRDVTISGSTSISGGLTLVGKATLLGGLTVESIGSAGATLQLLTDVTFFGRPYFTTDTVGSALVREGARTVEVTFDRDYTDPPEVTATLSLIKSSTNAAVESALFSQDIRYIVTGRTVHGFTILLNKPAPIDITFSWIALAAKNTKLFSSPIVTESPSPAPSIPVVAAPSPEPVPQIVATTTEDAASTTPAEEGTTTPAVETPVTESTSSPVIESAPAETPDAPEPAPAPSEPATAE